MNQSEILKSIELSGAADESVAAVRQLINVNVNNVTDMSGGRLRIRPTVVGRFRLILENPISSTISSLSIRCLNCKKVIHYPVWHYRIELARNILHYFVCFNSKNSTKPDLACGGRL